MSETTPTPGSESKRAPRRGRRLRRIAGFASLGLLVSVVVVVLGAELFLRPPGANSITLDRRLEAFPTKNLDLFAPVEIRWDKHHIPFILADDDRDVPYALGMVHAHLRLAQMEMMRQIARGAVSEWVGRFGFTIDRAIRTIDLDRAVSEMERNLPDDTRAWLERFVAGIEAYRAGTSRAPYELRRIAVRPDPWTVEDILRFGRMLSIDVQWIQWLGLARLRDEPAYNELRERLAAFHAEGIPSYLPADPTAEGPAWDGSKPGSNAFVIAPSRSKTGSALIASDPHLGIQLPCTFLIAGYRSPGVAAVGMMYPGAPFVLIGRNESIAWAGTNMLSVSSTAFDVSDRVDDGSSILLREESIATRFGRDRKVTIRETDVGPIITDLPPFGDLGLPPTALRWRGHEPSDEVSAMYRVNHASTWEQFHSAFADYAVSGQNLLFASRTGRIGMLPAIEYIPGVAQAATQLSADPDDPAHSWDQRVSSTDLPAALDPPAGYLASSNNTTVPLDPPLSPSGNANDRYARITSRIEELGQVDLDDLLAIQRDVFSAASFDCARKMHRMLDKADPSNASTATLLEALGKWDGHYATDSIGAVAYQAMLDALLDGAYTERYGDPIAGFLRSAGVLHHFVAEDMSNGTLTLAHLSSALDSAATRFDPDYRWGHIHRLRLEHPAAFAPVLGRWFRFDERPAPGSTTTVHKSAHAVSPTRHAATFGACARFLADLGDLDDNRFVLLGGQDGWFGSNTFTDQVDAFLEGETIRVPFREETVREAFPFRTLLEIESTLGD